jgi:hypothetical protein
MSNEQTRRSRESSGSGGAPMGSTAAIIIAIVAVVAGFLILREIRSDDSTAAVPDTTVATTIDPALTTVSVPAETTTTVPSMTYDGATAVVANASTVNGAAGVFTTALTGKGFTLAQATNASEKRADTVVYYVDGDTAALAVGTSIASLLGPGTSVQPMPTPPPVQDGALAQEVTVLVMLGSDKANSTLDQLAVATTTTAATTTVPSLESTTSAPPA